MRRIRNGIAGRGFGRDLEPGNLFVCERGGEQDVMKLLDFGLVHVAGDTDSVPAIEADASASASVGASSDHLRLTQAGHILGTPAYLSPEQAAGRDVDARSDIYSVGAVGYFLMAGRPPFLRATAAQMYHAHSFEPPPRLTKYCPGAPADLESVLLRCLAKQPEARYPDVHALESALAACACAAAWTSERAAAWWAEIAGTPRPSPGAWPQTDPDELLALTDTTGDSPDRGTQDGPG